MNTVLIGLAPVFSVHFRRENENLMKEGEEKSSGGAAACVPPVSMVRRHEFPACATYLENWTRWSKILEFSLSLIVGS